jgi:protein SCO1/2
MTGAQLALTHTQRRGIVKTVAAVAAFMALIMAIFIHGLNRERIMTVNEMKNNGAYLFEQPRIFKDFQLLNQNGEPVNAALFEGKWSLVFFGFTYCPDICPTTMALMNRFYQAQGEGRFGDDLQIVLVSVDPARDTPDKLKPYVEYFNPAFVGLTGEFLALHRFATQLNIPFSKVPGGGDNYTVEHSANIAIINPRGHYAGFFKAPHELSKLNLTYQSMRLMYDDL